MEDRAEEAIASGRQALERLENEWMQAVADRDHEKLEQIVGDGFRFTALHLHPDPMSREYWLEAMSASYTIVSFHYMEMDIDVFGDTGVVHARYSQVAHFNNVDLSNVFRLTDVWNRQDTGWRVVARHSSMVD